MDSKKRINQLSAQLLHHQFLYYVKAQPEIPDSEYDLLFHELQKLEKKYPQFAWKNSPCKRIGSDLDRAFPEKKHSIPVLSLDKEYGVEGLAAWADKIIAAAAEEPSFVVEEKIDGAAIVLYYSHGQLESALTRGDGFFGNDVTENVRTIGQVPLLVEEPSSFAVRGEIYLNKKDFGKFNAQFENKYANPRNLAAGSLRNSKSAIVAEVPLNIFLYEGFFPDARMNSHLEILLRMQQLNFRINMRLGYFDNDPGQQEIVQRQFPEIHRGSIAELSAFIKQRVQQRQESPYEIDGLVIKVNQIPLRQQLGYTAHHPRWAMAFKFEAPLAQTKLINIQIQVGRNGRVTPVAILQPISLSGSTVTRATLHNQDYIDMLELGIGDEVTISKRGDIIPAVEEVVEKNEKHPTIFKIPLQCPFCQAHFSQEGAHLFCRNEECPERRKRQLIYFCAKDQMDIETLGEKTIQLFYEKGWFRTIPDIYIFDYNRLQDVEGFQEKKIANIKASVEKSKNKPFEKVLTALGLEGVANAVVGELVANGFDTIDKIIAAAQRNEWEAFARIHGIGETTARLLVAHFRSDRVINIVKKLQGIGLCFQAEIKSSGNNSRIFAGQSWVITGSFANFQPRTQAADEIKRRGGKITTTVSSKTTHLLAGSAPGSKLQKAQSLGVKIVSEEEFLRVLAKPLGT